MNKLLLGVLLFFVFGLTLSSQSTHDGLQAPVRHVSHRIPVQSDYQRDLDVLRPAAAVVQSSQSQIENAPPNPWRLVASIPDAVITDLSFSSPLVGYAAGERGRVWKTTDGGVTWTRLVDLGDPYYYYGVVARKSEVAVSGFINGFNPTGVLRRSHDGGATWSEDIPFDTATYSVRFADASHGLAMTGFSWVSEGNSAYVTSNGGQTAADWTHLVPAPAGGWFGPQFSLLPSLHAAASGIQYCESRDAGANWTCRPSIDPISDDAVHFFTDNYGWVGGGTISPTTEGWVHRTTDGGQTWSDRTLQAPFPIRRIQFISPTVGWAAGGNTAPLNYGVVGGGIYFSNDGGQTWSLDLDSNGHEVYACDATTIGTGFQVWCAGFAGVNPFFTSDVYTVKGASTPDFSLAEGSYVGAQTVTMTTASGGATIYYTIDGSAPTTASQQYSGPIDISSTTTVRAIAGGTDYIQSAAASATYTIAPAQMQVSATTTAVSVRAGQSAVVGITVNSNGRPAGPVTFSCSGLPAGANCDFAPASLNASALPANVTVTISTGNSTAARRSRGFFATVALMLPGMLVLSVAAKRRHLRRAMLAILVLQSAVLLSCGGSPGSIPYPGERTGSSSVAVIASAAGASTSSVQIQLTVLR